MGSTRLTGSALSLTFDGVDYWADITKVQLTNVSVGEPLRDWHGRVVHDPRRYLITGAAVQSMQPTSFWRYVWENTGAVISFRYAPLGNHEPSEVSPHFVGQVRIGPPPTLGGDAGLGEYEFEFEWEVINTPATDDGTGPAS